MSDVYTNRTLSFLLQFGYVAVLLNWSITSRLGYDFVDVCVRECRWQKLQNKENIFLYYQRIIHARVKTLTKSYWHISSFRSLAVKRKPLNPLLKICWMLVVCFAYSSSTSSILLWHLLTQNTLCPQIT